MSSTTPALVLVEKRDGVATLTLNAPPANTYSYEMMRELDAAILDVRMDDAVHAVVITGASRGGGKTEFFCAGADIAMLKRVTPRYKYFFCLHANETLCRLEQTPKVVIAAINGHCVGGGLEVALAADLRVAKRGAGKLGLPEVSLGVLPGTGGTQRLVRLVGKARAMEMMLQGDLVEPDRARDLGIVNEVFDAEGFDEKVRDYARALCPPARAAKAAGLIKRAVQSGGEMSFESGLALERELQQQLFTSDDAREGIAAYVEKRKPTFTGM